MEKTRAKNSCETIPLIEFTLMEQKPLIRSWAQKAILFREILRNEIQITLKFPFSKQKVQLEDDKKI